MERRKGSEGEGGGALSSNAVSDLKPVCAKKKTHIKIIPLQSMLLI